MIALILCNRVSSDRCRLHAFDSIHFTLVREQTMEKQTMNDMNASRLADAAFAASRQVWLAGLGAAAVTRQWARTTRATPCARWSRKARPSRLRRFASRQRRRNIARDHELDLEPHRDQVRATVTALADTAVAALPKMKVPVRHQKAPVAKPRKAARSPASRRASPRRAASSIRRGKPVSQRTGTRHRDQ